MCSTKSSSDCRGHGSTSFSWPCIKKPYSNTIAYSSSYLVCAFVANNTSHKCTDFFYRYIYPKLSNLKLCIRAAGTPPWHQSGHGLASPPNTNHKLISSYVFGPRESHPLSINQGEVWRPRQIPSVIIRTVIFKLLLQNLKTSLPIISDLFHLCICGKYF